jgi:uncharacterized cupredoxin-like copper-binding protein
LVNRGLLFRLVSGGVAALVLGACAAHEPSAGARRIDVDVSDFHVTAPATVPAGDADIKVVNSGPDLHELIVVKADSASDLPLRSDGLTIDEEALQDDEAGAVVPFGPGEYDVMHVHLEPGRYIFLCNMSGHFLAGMATTVVAR